MTVEAELKRLNIEMEEDEPIKASYIPANQSGNLVFTSGQVCVHKGKLVAIGKVGDEVTIKEAQKAAEQCIVNCLSVLKKQLGNLEKIKKVVKVLGFVQSADGFSDQPLVINAASELLVNIFGEKGNHARSAVGVNGLPGNASVEIEIIVEIE